jgi:hypothetical protein
MPKATKVVVHFDDGSMYEVPIEKFGSLFTNEAKAKKCGHKPPWGSPPKSGGETDTATMSLMSTESTTSDDSTQEGETTCYWVNGVIICP